MARFANQNVSNKGWLHTLEQRNFIEPLYPCHFGETLSAERESGNP